MIPARVARMKPRFRKRQLKREERKMRMWFKRLRGRHDRMRVKSVIGRVWHLVVRAIGSIVCRLSDPTE